MKSKDPRPICVCSARPFPHKLDDSKCGGRAFLSFYLYNNTELCSQCNSYNEDTHSCDVLEGRESLKNAECYIEAKEQSPSEKVKISWE